MVIGALAEQGMKAFWRGNLVNCLRYAPQQGSALAFNDAINEAMPKYDKKTQYWGTVAVNLFSGGASGAIANTICYPLDFARTRLASDLGTGKANITVSWTASVRLSNLKESLVSTQDGV